MGLTRRSVLASMASLSAAGCKPRDTPPGYSGGWVGAQHERAHRLRTGMAGGVPAAAVQRRAGVVVVGAGVAGLAAARALRQAGVDDVQVLELEDTAGGNSRGHRMAGMACPLGAHYLPVPGRQAEEVIALLEELGLRSTRAGRVVYDERHLCHSPQERLFIDGSWHEGLLPPIDALPAAQRADTLAQYRRFGAAVQRAGRGGAFSVPTARSRWSSALDALDATPFAVWLDHQGLHAPALRWYLDYCCRDDYGAGAAQVSAWAGLHYFASRHGFQAPGDGPELDADEADGVLTWPEGNAWLAERLAAPLGDRLHTGRVALRVSEGRHAVEVDVWHVASHRVERWTAAQVVLAVPLFVCARLLATPPGGLSEVVMQMRQAPWLVANLQLDQPLVDRGGAAPAWDNVRYEPAADDGPGNARAAAERSAPAGSSALPPGLGYVDAMHQSTRPHPGPTVLTAYWALGLDDAGPLQRLRTRLLDEPWTTWARAVLHDVARAHPDLPDKVRRVDLMRYGHAMSIPLPGLRSSAALAALANPPGRVHFAHSDLSAYSVFEEAMYRGHAAGQRAALSRASAARSRPGPSARPG